MKDTPFLSVSNLAVEFVSREGNTAALGGISFEMSKGESVALIGESGSGKSVTADAIMQLIDPVCTLISGEIWFDGDPMHTLSETRLQKIRGKKIAMIFQDPTAALNPTMTVGCQIAESMIYHERMTKKEARTRTIELLDQVGIPDSAARFDAYPFQLSGGMRQRIVIAMALASHPSLLIADEPTTSLDVTIQAQILELLETICKEREMSLLFITHDLAVAVRMCERVIVMHAGVIVEDAQIQQLFDNPTHAYTKQLLAAAKREEIYL